MLDNICASATIFGYGSLSDCDCSRRAYVGILFLSHSFNCHIFPLLSLSLWERLDMITIWLTEPLNHNSSIIHISGSETYVIFTHTLVSKKKKKKMKRSVTIDDRSHPPAWRRREVKQIRRVFDDNWMLIFVSWTASSEFGTYRLCEQWRLRRACASAQSRQNLCCSLIQAGSQEEPSDRKPDPWPLWMAGHAQLKFVMTECSKTQIRLTGLSWNAEDYSKFRKLVP